MFLDSIAQIISTYTPLLLPDVLWLVEMVIRIVFRFIMVISCEAGFSNTSGWSKTCSLPLEQPI